MKTTDFAVAEILRHFEKEVYNRLVNRNTDNAYAKELKMTHLIPYLKNGEGGKTREMMNSNNGTNAVECQTNKKHQKQKERVRKMLNTNKKKKIFIIIVSAIIVAVIAIGAFAESNKNNPYAYNNDYTNEYENSEDTFIPDYTSEDQINTMGNTNSNYLQGAVAAGQGSYQYYIKDEYFICKEEIYYSPPEFYIPVWSPSELCNSTGNRKVARLSVCGDWLYFLLGCDLCRVRTDGSQFSYLIMSNETWGTETYVVYNSKVYLKKMIPISASSTSDYIYEFDPETSESKQICDANSCVFLGMDEEYIVLYETQKGYVYGYVEDRIFIYKTSGDLVSTIKLNEDDHHELRMMLSDGKLYCFGYSSWSHCLSLNDIKVIRLADGKTEKALNQNPTVETYLEYGHLLVSKNDFIVTFSGGLGYMHSDWDDYTKWIQINDDTSIEDISVVNDQIYYTMYEKNTTSGDTDLYRVSKSVLASDTHDFESLSDKTEFIGE